MSALPAQSDGTGLHPLDNRTDLLDVACPSIRAAAEISLCCFALGSIRKVSASISAMRINSGSSTGGSGDFGVTGSVAVGEVFIR